MIKYCIGIALSIALTSVSSVTLARDDKNMYSIQEAMTTSAATEKLNKGYTFKFGSQSHGSIAQKHGEFMSNKKTNAFNKTDKEACQWAFLSAMLSFQDRITSTGGNAVVNIRSYYRKNEISSATEFEARLWLVSPSSAMSLR
ncbi:MAG: hypothetical protein Hals2KO_12310 [Halioglobus sp.]